MSEEKKKNKLLLTAKHVHLAHLIQLSALLKELIQNSLTSGTLK